MAHTLDSPAMLGQEEEARGAGPAGRRQSSGEAPREDGREEEEIQFIGQMEGKAGRANQRASIKGGEKDTPRRKDKEAKESTGREADSEGRGRKLSGRDLLERAGLQHQTQDTMDGRKANQTSSEKGRG